MDNDPIHFDGLGVLVKLINVQVNPSRQGGTKIQFLWHRYLPAMIWR